MMEHDSVCYNQLNHLSVVRSLVVVSVEEPRVESCCGVISKQRPPIEQPLFPLYSPNKLNNLSTLTNFIIFGLNTKMVGGDFYLGETFHATV